MKKLAGMTPMAEIIDGTDNSAPLSPQYDRGEHDYNAGYPEDEEEEDLFSGGEPEGEEEVEEEVVERTPPPSKSQPSGSRRGAEKRREIVKESESEDEKARGRAMARGTRKGKKVERQAPEPLSRLPESLALRESVAYMNRKANDPLDDIVDGILDDEEVQAKKTRVFDEKRSKQSPGYSSKPSSSYASTSKAASSSSSSSKSTRGKYQLQVSESEDEDITQFRLEISRKDAGPSTSRSRKPPKRGRSTTDDESDDDSSSDNDAPRTPKSKKLKQQSVTPSSHARRSQRLQNTPQSEKKMDTSATFRLRTMFTETETENLINGVRTFGVGNWAVIRDRYNFKNRSSVDLKDKYRNLLKKGLIPRDLLPKD